MTTEEMKALAARMSDAINTGDFAVFDELVAADAVDHSLPPGVPRTGEGAKTFMSAFRAAFPDLHYTIEDSIAEGDRVVQRVTGTGTMKGEFQGMPAANKPATWSEIHIMRIANGRISEHWAIVDLLNMMAQLGFIAMPGGQRISAV